MLKAEQVPTEAINAYMHMIVYGGVDGAEAIAAALNAWPGMEIEMVFVEENYLILPLRKENTSD